METQKKINFSEYPTGYPVIIEGSPLLHWLKHDAKLNGEFDVLNNFIEQFGATIDPPENTVYYLIKNGLYPGNSGGVCKGTEGYNKNKLLGVPTISYSGTGLGGCVPDYVLKEVVPKIFNRTAHKPYYTGLVLADPAGIKEKINMEFFKSYFGFTGAYFELLEMETGALVVGFSDDSPFKNSEEIKYGDLITHLNNEPILNHFDFVKKLKSITTPQLEIKITRVSQDQRLIVTKQEIIVIKTKSELSSLRKSTPFTIQPFVIKAEVRGENIVFNPLIKYLD